MNIELLSKMIGELVLDHSSVGLPGLGTFVVEDVPACFADRGYTINPPYRSLSFQPGCTDDGAIVSYYAECNNISEDSSRAILKDYLTQLAALIKTRRSLNLPQLGRLKMTDGGKMFFIPDEDLVIYPDGLPLEPISLKNHFDKEDVADVPVTHISDILAHDSETESKADPVEKSENTRGTARKPEAEPWYKNGRLPYALLFLAVALIVLFCTFLVLVEVAPDFIDSLLYTPEELEIINW